MPARVWISPTQGQLKTGLRGTWLRRGLVVSQFTVSILLIVGTITAYRQLDYMQTKQTASP